VRIVEEPICCCLCGLQVWSGAMFFVSEWYSETPEGYVCSSCLHSLIEQSQNGTGILVKVPKEKIEAWQKSITDHPQPRNEKEGGQ
jgi:hypothetical protein